MIMDCGSAADSLEMDINPDDISLNDNVTIVWKIK